MRRLVCVAAAAVVLVAGAACQSRSEPPDTQHLTSIDQALRADIGIEVDVLRGANEGFPKGYVVRVGGLSAATEQAAIDTQAIRAAEFVWHEWPVAPDTVRVEIAASEPRLVASFVLGKDMLTEKFGPRQAAP